MGIISKLKSVFTGGDGERAAPGDGGASAAVEPEPAAESERAVKGVDTGSGSPDATSAVGEEADPGTDRDERSDGAPVDSIKGIGDAYAERLADAGVDDVADLAAADADTLAEETGLGSGRVGKWIERAEARSR